MENSRIKDTEGTSSKVVGAIEYFKNGDGLGIHSDLDFKGPVSDEYRRYLHSSLDEWLNKSCGSGCWFLSEPNYEICTEE